LTTPDNAFAVDTNHRYVRCVAERPTSYAARESHDSLDQRRRTDHIA